MKILDILNKMLSKNYKAYLLFLVLTLILWFTIQLVKSYTYQCDLKVTITEMPKHIVVDTTIKNLGLSLKANGLKLWKYNLSDKLLKVNYKDFEKDSLQLKITSDYIKNTIINRFKFDLEKINIDEAYLAFDYHQKITKKVPINTEANLSFSTGYNTLQVIDIIPDSVVISGPQQELNKIRRVNTEKLILKNINDTLRGKVNLKSPSKSIEISKSQVEYFLPVEKFSEKALMIDIKTINIPDSLELSIFPNQAKVSFLVSLKSFDKVSNLDFKVICDYTKRYEKDGIMIPKLQKHPSNILNPKLHIKKVDYLIKQKP